VIPPAGKCVWGCDSGKPFNQEHIIGKHVAKALDISFPVPMNWGDIHRSTGEIVDHGERLEDELKIVLADRVCERCNGQWMRKLDKRMLQFMWNTLRHEERVQLNAGKQQTLALWATKVGLLLALWFHDQPFDAEHLGPSFAPADNFLAVGKHMRPPERTRIWIGAIAPTVSVREFSMSASALYEIPTDAEPIPRGYYTVVQLKRLVLFVTGWELDYADYVGQGPNAEAIVRARALSRIWPMSERVVEWPPPSYLESDDLDNLVKAQPSGVQPAQS